MDGSTRQKLIRIRELLMSNLEGNEERIYKMVLIIHTITKIEVKLQHNMQLTRQEQNLVDNVFMPTNLDNMLGTLIQEDPTKLN